LQEAEAVYRSILARQPRHPDALHLLGVVAYSRGEHARAVKLIEKAIRLNGKDAAYFSNLGLVYQRIGKLTAAIANYRKALKIHPDYADAHNNLGFALKNFGQFSAASVHGRMAIALKPDFAEAHNNRGLLQRDFGVNAAAVDAFRRSVTLNPRLVEGLRNLGLAYVDLKHFSYAAQAQLRKVAVLTPSHPEVHANLGGVMINVGHAPAAVSCFSRAMATANKERIPDHHSSVIVAKSFIRRLDFFEQYRERRVWFERHGLPFATGHRRHRNQPEPARMLRIGYVSADFRYHSASAVFGPIILSHRSDRFEVACYSNSTYEDELTRKFRDHARLWRTVTNLDDDSLAQQIHDDRIDILVDLSGHTAGHRLLAFARKPAPIQATGWGYGGGTGLTTMDYWLADPTMAPDAWRSTLLEQVVDLPCNVTCPLPAYAPVVEALPALRSAPIVTFGSFNRLQKLTYETLSLWGALLSSMPSARLTVKDRTLDEADQKSAIQRKLTDHGIDPSRVTFWGATGHAEHLAAHSGIDIALDPYPYGGGMSTFDALWMGVPVLTLCGRTASSRAAASVLNPLGLGEWVAEGPEDFVSRGRRLAGELDRLAELRCRLRGMMQTSPVGNAVLYTRIVEAAYRQMWTRWCQGLPPVSFVASAEGDTGAA
jgi:predicted O-linked N-acetylglucosamine transferase (SPINDLY family)